MSFPRYPKYKDSGVELLGNVPAHWEVRELRHLGRVMKGSGGSKEDIVEDGVPCVRYGDLYTTHSFHIERARTFVSRERATAYTPIQFGDVLFAASGEKLEEIGKSAVNLIRAAAVCGGDLVLLRPRVGLKPRFIGYAADSAPSVLQKASMGRGTTVKHIYPDELRHLAIALPSEAEQEAIAAFLDRETMKIDALVAEQERLIELLKEKRQAVISHAVTKGLTSNVPMKDSGIEWLGQVPATWAVAPLKRLASIRYGIGEPPTYRDSGVPLVRATNVHAGKLFWEGMTYVDAADIPSQRIVWLAENDIIVVRSGAYTGDSAIIPSGFGASIAGFDMVLRCHSARPLFIQFALLSKYLKEGQLDVSKMRAAQPHLNAEELGACLIALPSAAEQAEVEAFLAQQTADLDSLVGAAQRVIELLQERRTALISSAVTGQIDVRPESMKTAV